MNQFYETTDPFDVVKVAITKFQNDPSILIRNLEIKKNGVLLKNPD